MESALVVVACERDLELLIKVDFVIIMYSCSASASRIPGSEYITLPVILSQGFLFRRIVYEAYREGFEKVASVSLLACCQ